jgi:hypothetical protein
MGTGSLICANASLMRCLNSLLGRNKFPAPMRRELARKRLTLLPYSACPVAALRPISPKFPANSQLAGNFGLSETGSSLSLLTAAESDVLEAIVARLIPTDGVAAQKPSEPYNIYY